MVEVSTGRDFYKQATNLYLLVVFFSLNFLAMDYIFALIFSSSVNLIFICQIFSYFLNQVFEISQKNSENFFANFLWPAGRLHNLSDTSKATGLP